MLFISLLFPVVIAPVMRADNGKIEEKARQKGWMLIFGKQ